MIPILKKRNWVEGEHVLEIGNWEFRGTIIQPPDEAAYVTHFISWVYLQPIEDWVEVLLLNDDRSKCEEKLLADWEDKRSVRESYP